MTETTAVDIHALTARCAEATPRYDWSRAEIATLFDLPFNDLLFLAQQVHRKHFDANEVQMSSLLSIKTGGCPEDCGYCSQSAHFQTGLKASKLMEMQATLEAARAAKAQGASRFCMGAAWRNPKDHELDKVCDMIAEVKAMGMETCATLGMLTPEQADKLKTAGLDYYNHNLDTSPEHYNNIVSTRSYQDRLDTLSHVRDAGMKVCCGGILGIGEQAEDRIGLLHSLATLPAHPESAPINMLMQVRGTPLGNAAPPAGIDFVRTIAVARIILPQSMVRLSAGREHMSDELQALCFLAGANSIFLGDKLLTTKNPGQNRDEKLLGRLGIRPMPYTTVEEDSAPVASTQAAE